MGGSSTINTSETRIEALKLQSSAYGVTVPVVGGTNRIAGNLLYYADFQAIPHTTSTSSGKGGGVKTTNTTYTYQASVIMSIGHGPIQDVKSIWVGKARYDAQWIQPPTVAYSEVTPATGTYTVLHPTGFNGVQSISYTWGTLTDASDTQTFVGAEGVDYTVNLATGQVTFLPGNGFAGAPTIKYTSTTPGATQSAAQQLGVTLVRGAAAQAAQAAPSWVQTLHPGDAIGYPYQAYVHAQNYQLGTGAQVENHTFEVVGYGAYAISPAIPDCNPADFARSILLDARYGARVPASALQSFAMWSDYCLASGLVLSPALTEQQPAAQFISLITQLTNSAPIWSVSKLKVVPYGDQALTGNGATFTPNVTPIYDLTDDHFIVATGEAPIKATRNSQADRYNNVKIQFSNRANFYNTEVAEVKDDADVAQNGLRTMPDVSGDWICDAQVARAVAQLLMQRSLNVTTLYEFKLPWAFCLLEPMDLVTLTDAELGLNKTAVRITEISEDENGMLTLKAESFAQGVASAALYPSQAGSGYQANYNAVPGSVATPVIFEAPAGRTLNGLGVYAAATGQQAGWGGCNVWASLDGGVNYQRVGTITSGARIGKLASAMAAGDTTLQVMLDGIGGQINNASPALAAQNQSLVWVEGPQGGEYMNFVGATLNSKNAYTLTGLVRGAYGNPANAHSQNARFARVDDAIELDDGLDLTYIGKTLYFKFTSFNLYGAGEESLSAVQAYPYTVTGGQVGLPPSNVGNVQLAGQVVSWTPVTDPDVRSGGGYRVRLQQGANADWGTAAPLHDGLLTQVPFTMTYQPQGTVTVLVKAVDALGNESTQAGTAIASVGVPAVQNILASWPQAPAFAGTVSGGTISGGVLQASGTTPFWPSNIAAAFWNQLTTNFWPPSVWSQLQYSFTFATPGAGRVLLDIATAADATTVEYQRGDQTPFWPAAGGGVFWGASAAPFWPAFTPTWKAWLGGLDVAPSEPITLRVTLTGGANQGSITTLTPKLNVPDVREIAQGVVVASGGTRVAITKSYRVIKSVTCAVKNDGNGGVGYLVLDKDVTLGPLIEVLNSSGAPVTGLVDAVIEGY